MGRVFGTHIDGARAALKGTPQLARRLDRRDLADEGRGRRGPRPPPRPTFVRARTHMTDEVGRVAAPSCAEHTHMRGAG